MQPIIWAIDRSHPKLITKCKDSFNYSYWLKIGCTTISLLRSIASASNVNFQHKFFRFTRIMKMMCINHARRKIDFLPPRKNSNIHTFYKWWRTRKKKIAWPNGLCNVLHGPCPIFFHMIIKKWNLIILQVEIIHFDALKGIKCGRALRVSHIAHRLNIHNDAAHHEFEFRPRGRKIIGTLEKKNEKSRIKKHNSTFWRLTVLNIEFDIWSMSKMILPLRLFFYLSRTKEIANEFQNMLSSSMLPIKFHVSAFVALFSYIHKVYIRSLSF